MSRRGATLLELIVALTLTSLVSLMAGRILMDAAARLRDRSERMAGEHALRVAGGAARAALESLGRDSAAGADLGAIGPRSFTGRMPRGAGVLCAAAGDLVTVRRGPGWWSAVREPVEDRDSLLLAAITGPPHWIAVALEGAPRVVACPDGSAGMGLPVSLDEAELAAIGAGGGSAVRLMEPVEYRMYSSTGGGQWVGLRAVATGESIQPLAGPLAAQGLDLVYLGTSGAPTTDPAEARSVVLRVNGLTERAGGIGLARLPGGAADSVAMFIALIP